MSEEQIDDRWKLVVEDLVQSLTVVQIANEIGVTAQTIHDIKALRTKQPKASIAMALLRLQKRQKARLEREEARERRA